MTTTDKSNLGTYRFSCACGASIEVAASSAGDCVLCKMCSQSVDVPSLRDLKRLEGESLLTAVDDLRFAIVSEAPPFDGCCQICGVASATVRWSAIVAYLHERKPIGAPVSVGIGLGSVSLKIGGAAETWEQVDVPCMFCVPCQKRYLGNYHIARLTCRVKSKLMEYPPITNLVIRVSRLREPALIRHLRRLELVRKLLDQEREHLVTLKGRA